MVHSLRYLAAVLFALSPPGQSAPAEAAGKLDGKWIQVEGNATGYDLSKNRFTITIEGDRFREAEVIAPMTYRYRLDVAQSPPTIDRIGEGGVAEPGVLEISGRPLTLCFAKPGEDRPPSVKTGENLGRYSYTWERVGVLPPTGVPLGRQIEGNWTLISVKSAKADIPKATVQGGRMTIADGQMKMTNTRERAGKIVVRPASREIDLEFGADPRFNSAGIYQLVDADTLKICTCPAPLGRPSDFAVEAGSTRTLRVLKRARD